MPAMIRLSGTSDDSEVRLDSHFATTTLTHFLLVLLLLSLHFRPFAVRYYPIQPKFAGGPGSEAKQGRALKATDAISAIGFA